MISLIQKYKFQVIAIVLGAIGGYAYYYFVGCKTGTCAITSSPIISSLYGAMMGYLVMGIFKTKKTEKDD